MVDSSHVPSGCSIWPGFGENEMLRSVRTERHLLRPFNVLVTARAGYVQSALVPYRRKQVSYAE